MIGRLTGTLVDRDGSRGILDVGGVGYEVWAPAGCLDRWAAASEAIVAHVHTHVTETDLSLYGFDSREARQAFRALLGVSGVGPKVALAALDALDVAALAQAVEAGDIGTLSRIKGVGKKTAQRMAIDLKGKLPGAFAPSAPPTASGPDPADPLPAALRHLGYSRAEIARATDALAARGMGPDAPVAQRLRAALALLSGSPA